MSKLLVVHGAVKQRRVGLLRAMFIVCWELARGYKNTLITDGDYKVIVAEDGRGRMYFEVDSRRPLTAAAQHRRAQTENCPVSNPPPTLNGGM